MRMVRRSLVIGLVGAALTTGIASGSDLDQGFGEAGKVVTDVSGQYDEIRALAIQPDDRIVATGPSGAAPRRDFALARYDADGSLDQTFGKGGFVVTDFATGDDVPWALAIQADGKIVVGGTADGDFAFARYQVNGALDPGFGVGGRVVVALGGNARVNGLSIQRDGRIVGAGVAGGVDFALVRLQTDGSADPTFGFEGRAVTDVSSGVDVAFAVTSRPDGRIIVTGSAGAFPNARFAVCQYTVEGLLDSGFGVGGTTLVGFPRDARAHALALQPDAKVRVGGFINNGSSTDGVVVQLTADGVLDPSFGDGGRVATDFGGRNFGTALVFQSDGRFVVGGSDDFPPYYDFALARYEADGRIDASFNPQGTFVTAFGRNSWINAVAVQSDGKVVAAGYARGASGADFALVRYLSR